MRALLGGRRADRSVHRAGRGDGASARRGPRGRLPDGAPSESAARGANPDAAVPRAHLSRAARIPRRLREQRAARLMQQPETARADPQAVPERSNSYCALIDPALNALLDLFCIQSDLRFQNYPSVRSFPL